MEHLTNETLLAHLKELVNREQEILNEVLEHLAEVERRKLHLLEAYPSLFEFCTRYLGYSANEAYLRIQAVRLIRDVPAAEPMLKTGKLSLSNAALLQTHLQQESKRRKKLKIAPIPAPLRTLLVESAQNLSKSECLKSIHETFPALQPIPVEKTVPLANGKFMIQFVADEHLLKGLNDAKDVFARSDVQRYDQLIAFLLRYVFKRLHPLRGDAPFLCQTKEQRDNYLLPKPRL